MEERRRVLIVLPPVEWPAPGVLPRQPPMVAAYLAAVLRDSSHDPKILDLYLTPLEEAELGEEVRRFQPDHVVLVPNDGLRDTPLEVSLTIAGALKRQRPTLRIGLFDHQDPASLASRIGGDPSIDFLVGQGSPTAIVHALDPAPTGANGASKGGSYRISVRRNGSWEHVSPPRIGWNPDELPYPAWDLCPPMERYEVYPQKQRYGMPYPVMASFGCPYPCRFCPAHSSGYASRSPSHVIREMAHLQSRYGASEIHFCDPLFGFRREWIKEFLDRLEKEGPRLRWSCLTRADLVTAPILRRMSQAGCWNITFGIESGNPEIRNRTGKNLSQEAIAPAVRMAQEAHIEVTGDFILGLPGDTEESIWETVRYAIQLGLDYAAFFLYRIPRGEETAGDAGRPTPTWDLDGHDFRRGPFYLPVDIPDPARLKKLQRSAYRAFYLRGGYIMKRLASLRHPRDLRRWAKALRLLAAM